MRNASSTVATNPLETRDLFGFEAFVSRVEERFRRRSDLLTATSGDHALNPDYNPSERESPFKPAAVLIGIANRGDDAMVILTQRAAHLSSHSGQIAFPGGKIDAGETPIEAALREADEEIGLSSDEVTVLGAMGTYYSGSGYSITPVIATVNDQASFSINRDEVAELFEVPLRFLMDRQNRTLESRFWKGKERHYYVMDFDDPNRALEEPRRIWGVTAGIIATVQERLYGG
ncbi:MAG: CoA pyrophosphatase [Pseudomonadota bacterium]